MRFFTFTLCILSIECLLGNPVYSQQNSWTNENILVFNSEPEGASVIIDNEFKGKTPLEIKYLPKGRYTVTLSMDGYSDKTYYVEMTGSRVEKYVIMSGDYALLNLTSEPSGADFYFNDIKMGQTPVINFRMPLGKQNITLKKSEYKDATTYLQVVSFKYELNKLLEPRYSVFKIDNSNNLTFYLDGFKTDIKGDSIIISDGMHSFRLEGRQFSNSLERSFLVESPKAYNISVDNNSFTLKYTFYSFVIPGLGQILDGSFKKGLGIMIGMGISGAYYVIAKSTYDNKLNEFNERKYIYDISTSDVSALENYKKMEESANAVNKYKSNPSIGLGIIAVVYAINLFDVFYNHTREASLNISPYNSVNSTGINIKWNIN